MGYLLSITLLFYFSLTSLLAKDQKVAISVATSDIAIFRLPSQVYFQTDILKMISSFERFRCVYPKSLLEDTAGLSGNKIFQANSSVLASEFIEGVIRIEKMKLDVEASFQIDLNDFWLEIRGGKCLKNGPNNWSKYLRSLFLLEIFLNQQWSSLDSKAQKIERQKWSEKVQDKYKHHLFNYAQ